MCVRLPADRESVYRPVIEDFKSRNQGTLLLRREFDLPAYSRVTLSAAAAIRDKVVLVDV